MSDASAGATDVRTFLRDDALRGFIGRTAPLGAGPRLWRDAVVSCAAQDLGGGERGEGQFHREQWQETLQCATSFICTHSCRLQEEGLKPQNSSLTNNKPSSPAGIGARQYIMVGRGGVYFNDRTNH
jgi:hypothetical protein